jgi:hypothetical protein
MQFHVVEPVSIKLWLIPITILAAGQRSSGTTSKIPGKTIALSVRRPSGRRPAGEKGK